MCCGVFGAISPLVKLLVQPEGSTIIAIVIRGGPPTTTTISTPAIFSSYLVENIESQYCGGDASPTFGEG